MSQQEANMRQASIGRKIFGLSLAIGTIALLPLVVFGAERIATVAGRLGEQQTVVFQQAQPVPTIESLESKEPATKRIYVQPRWADGGHGVQVAVPGHWNDAKETPKR
jgi:hypothetical protein